MKKIMSDDDIFKHHAGGRAIKSVSKNNREFVKEMTGDIVEVGTNNCAKWKSMHGNCSNCPSELGCVKAVYIGILDLEVTIKSITKDDYREKVEAVIAAESIESVKGIVLGAIPNST